MTGKELFAGFLFVIIAFATIFGLGACTYISPGNIGVKTSLFGGTNTGGTFSEGLNFKIPFIEDIKQISARTQITNLAANASSKDMQEVSTGVALNYSVIGSEAALLYKEIGLEWETVIIAPYIQEAVKAVTAKYTAEQLIHNRSQVKDEIAALVKGYIEGKHLKFVSLALVNFEFSNVYTHAIEQKQVAEQKALEAEQTKKQTVTQAEAIQLSAIVNAEGVQKTRQLYADTELYEAEKRAQANKLLQSSITPELLQLKALEKWNGILPTVSSGDAVPFIQVQTSAVVK